MRDIRPRGGAMGGRARWVGGFGLGEGGEGEGREVTGGIFRSIGRSVAAVSV
jgi:hypothetical protein